MVQLNKARNLVQSPPPSSAPDWLPSGHLAWFVHDAVESLDIDRLLGDHFPCGKSELPCPPRVMLRLLIYAYCTGTFSSRRIAANIEVSTALRVLAASHEPSHRTLRRFLDENLDEFNRAFVQVVEIAREAKLVKMGTIVIDSSKVEANASQHRAMSDDWMLMEEQRLREETAKLTRAAKKQDELDDAAVGPAAVTSRPRRGDARIASRRSQDLARRGRIARRQASTATRFRRSMRDGSSELPAPPGQVDGC